ncbi:hypothetical protein BFN10_03010 [Pseudomonas extremorientalis]|uniref:Uncharacterized protein n=1 Tax=Pseudomonas extremorientalis TaxID=169669 RepID=A0A1S2TS24_9PSED|nr:hypothetical protein BFN10_03010 [Pseudomonas extremorientalis]
MDLSPERAHSVGYVETAGRERTILFFSMIIEQEEVFRTIPHNAVAAEVKDTDVVWVPLYFCQPAVKSETDIGEGGAFDVVYGPDRIDLCLLFR